MEKYLYILKGVNELDNKERLVAYVLSDNIESTIYAVHKENVNFFVLSITKGERIVEETDRNNVVLTIEKDYDEESKFSILDIKKALVIYKIDDKMKNTIINTTVARNAISAIGNMTYFSYEVTDVILLV